jgi:hypothetical protein
MPKIAVVMLIYRRNKPVDLKTLFSPLLNFEYYALLFLYETSALRSLVYTSASR